MPTQPLSLPVFSASLPAAAPRPSLAQPQPDQPRLERAAQDFAAVALNELLAPMFDTVDTANGDFGGGAGEQAWTPMLVREFANHLAQSGGLGLAEPIYQQMLRLQQKSSP